MSKPTTAAQILSALSNSHSAYSGDLATKLGVSKATLIRHCRKLAERGFVFCEDDYDGRNRKGGKYANALWVINCETSGFSAEKAQEALNLPGNGYEIMTITLDLGC